VRFPRTKYGAMPCNLALPKYKIFTYISGDMAMTIPDDYCE